MGCITSSNSGSAAVVPAKTKSTSDRIDRVLATKKGEVDKSGHTMTFEKILLKFEKLRVVLAYIKAVFISRSGGSDGLNYDGLKSALKILHGPMEREEIIELFEFVDLDDSKVIEFKEFLVALTVGHVLNIMPVAEKGEANNRAPEEGQTLQKKGSLERIDGLTASVEEINMVLNLIVSAYLLFDPNGTGAISRESVQGMIEEGKGKNSNAMLSQDRWGEMDWDANGSIDFAEFVHAFSSWVDLEGEDDH